MGPGEPETGSQERRLVSVIRMENVSFLRDGLDPGFLEDLEEMLTLINNSLEATPGATRCITSEKNIGVEW